MKRTAFIIVVIALAVCLTGIRVHAQSAESWYERGLEAETSAKYEIALQAYSEAIKLNPFFSPAYLKRASLIYMLSPTRSLEAIHDLTKAIENDPENAEAFYQRAMIYFFILNNESARQDMIKAAGLGHEGARTFLDTPATAALSNYVHLGSYTRPERTPIVFFDFDSTHISQYSEKLLDAFASVLRNELPDITVYITGHTDNRGSEDYNQTLSMKRAQAVKSYLLSRGVAPEDRLVVRYYGESRPLFSNDTEEGRSKNRRAELIGFKR